MKPTRKALLISIDESLKQISDSNKPNPSIMRMESKINNIYSMVDEHLRYIESLIRDPQLKHEREKLK